MLPPLSQEEHLELENDDCPTCKGHGWDVGHNTPESHHPYDGSCLNCPVQVQCDDCSGTGKIKI